MKAATKKKAAVKVNRNSPVAGHEGIYPRGYGFKSTCRGKVLGKFKTLAEAVKARAEFLAKQAAKTTKKVVAR